ncbi:MAG TPA: helix-turn-helix domain-containing protein [Gemmatimonadales bacterium]|jgi:DeoR family suf operon transcriptional repressor|nr:helix-turn-helix domain-containing protein [Gemmatimonadales bacterium]
MAALPLAPLTDTIEPVALARHRGPRATLLIVLKEGGSATAKALAAALHCSLNAVRHHLKELEVEGAVEHDPSPHGVGAPPHVFRLTPRGHGLFPHRYEQTVADLLDHLVATQGRPAAVALLQSHYRALEQRVESECALIAPERRGEVVARLLALEGYMATWSPSDAGGTLTEHNCPHRVVAERFPEVCAAEQAFLARAFGAAIERQSRITGGCGTCSYRVTAPADPEGVAP